MRPYILILLFGFFAGTVKADAYNLIVKYYSSENGLPHNSVYASLKDKQGMMWFATWYGLSSFDGVKFRKYNTRNDFNADIPPHKLQSLVEANDYSLWVKTIDHKLFLFDKRTESYYDVFNEIRKKYNVGPKIIKIQKTDEGDLLMLTRNRDLLLAKAFENGRMEVTLLHDSQMRSELWNAGKNLWVESQEYINWIGSDFSIFSRRKGKMLQSKPADFITTKLGNGPATDFSAVHVQGSNIWLGDRSGNLAIVNYETGNVKKRLVFPGKMIQHIVRLNDQTMMVSVTDGVYELDAEWNVVRKIFDVNAGERTTQSLIDSYDKMWFLIGQKAVVYYDPVNNSSRRFAISEGKVIPDVRIVDGFELGIFFITTAGDVLWFDRQGVTLTVLNTLKELQPDGVYNSFFNLQLDEDKILWLSSTSRGVFRLSFPKRQFNLLRIPGNQPPTEENPVKTLYQSKDGDIWVATRKPEMYRLDRSGQIKQVFSKTQNFFPGNVYHIMEDRAGNMWFSTKGNGLVKAVPDAASPMGFRFSRFINDTKNPYSISGNEVYYTYQDSRGNIWVGLFGGGLNLIREENGQTLFYHKNNSFHRYPRYGLYMEVRGIVEDRNGRVWVGTSDGLMSFESQFNNPSQINFEIYRNESVQMNVLDNDIYFLYRDSGGDVWISVFGGGLNKLESYENGRPVFHSYSLYEGMNSDVILSIVEDEDNYLWLATENALARFDKKLKTFRNFDRYDGFINVRMEEGSAIRCQNGEIWFGNRMGILAFNPRKIETVNVNYQTLIVDFLISNREIRSFRDKPLLKESIRYAESITLKHNQNNIVLEFAALNYYNLNRVSYKYILEGFEDEWHYNGKNRIASYPNVPPGKYVFVVQSIDEANMDLKSERRLEIRVLPPWWRSWWAYSIYTLIGLALAWAIQRLVLFTIRMRNDVYIEQKVSEMKLRFFTNISHELRTPLTLIMGPLHELREKQNLTDKGKQYVALIERSANQMLQLVNQILEFRKLEHGKVVLHVGHNDLNKIIAGIASEFEILAEEKQISYSVHLFPADILVWVDKERIEMVARNLISNAFKFTEPGGGIFVSTALSDDMSRCSITVEDTGIGIPSNKIEEIFERFTQGDNTKHAYYQGTGIGLHLCREIVSLHHGNISVKTRPEKGSIFTVELFTGDEHFDRNEVDFYLGVENEKTHVQQTATNEMSIVEEQQILRSEAQLPLLLVVEDNRDLCDMLKLQLEDKYRVVVAYNGSEGLKKVSQHHPDLVITDIMMPEMSGTEMLQEIRKDIAISHIPVIILTAKHNEEAKIQAISMGANAYITKPFNKDYLIARVEQLLNDRKLFRERIWNQEVQRELSKEETYENYLVNKDRQLLDKIHQVISENIQNAGFNIDAIADSLGFSRSAFFKKLKSMTGLAPVDLIKEIRLGKSLDLLKHTDMSISEIAFEVGFSDAGYYGKCFRKKYQMTPSEYIHKYREVKS